MRQLSFFRDCPKCKNCSEYENCGGCHDQCMAGSCLKDFSDCGSCVLICCLHPELSQYLADVNGTNFPSFGKHKINYPVLPGVIPELTDRWDAEKPYPYKWIGVEIGLLYNKKSGLKLESLKNLHVYLRIPEETQIILVNHDEDWLIEDYWRNALIKGYIEALARANIVLATGFNYSLFDEHARMTHLISMKKSLITAKELTEAGLPTIPHLYWKTRRDLDRWVDFLRKNDSIQMASLNFTFKKRKEEFNQAVKDVKYIADNVGRKIRWLVVGVFKVNKVKYLARQLSHVSVMSAKIIRLAKSRRVITDMGIVHLPALTQYAAFLRNTKALIKAWEFGNKKALRMQLRGAEL